MDSASGDGELRERLAAIVDSSDDAIISHTLAGVVTSWNAGAERIYGYTAEEMTGRHAAVLFPPDRTGELSHILDRLRRGERIDHYETRRVRKDGTVIDVSISVSPVHGAGGRVVGVANVSRDITGRNQAEAAARRLERMEAVGHLAGGIAHEFSDLLGIIIDRLELIAGQTAGLPALQADVELIRAAARRAADLVDELLVFSGQDAGRPGITDLNSVISGVRSLVSASTGLTVVARFDLADTLPPVVADPHRLEQAVINLVVNARDAMPLGGTVTIGTGLADLGEGDPELPPGRYVELTVRDTGTGMSPEVAARVFDPFFTTKPPGQGAGLGLTTVYRTVADAGGAISVDSAPGAGTAMRIYLPAATVPAPRSADTAPAGDAAAGRETILVVDDEPAVRTVAARILRGDGYTVLEAAGGEEALLLASAHDVSLLLTDTVMPRMSGAALADRVHQLKPGLPVVYMSGYDAEILRREGTGDGDQAFLAKPFTAAAMLALVRATLGRPASPARHEAEA